MSRPSHAFKDERCSVWAFCEAEVLMLKRRLRERQRKVGFWSSKATCQTCQSCQFSQCRNGSASFSNGILQGAESRDLDHPWPTWALTVTVHCNKLQDVTRSCDAPTWRQQLVHGHICAQERGNAAAALLLPIQPGRLRHILVSPPACQAVSKAGEWSPWPRCQWNLPAPCKQIGSKWQQLSGAKVGWTIFVQTSTRSLAARSWEESLSVPSAVPSKQDVQWPWSYLNIELLLWPKKKMVLFKYLELISDGFVFPSRTGVQVHMYYEYELVERHGKLSYRLVAQRVFLDRISRKWSMNFNEIRLEI